MKKKIKEIVNEILDMDIDIKEDENLALYGLDSMGTMKLIVGLEQVFGISIDEDDLLLENFDSINKICSLVDELVVESARIEGNMINSNEKRKKIAIVTGANRGIGYGIAKELYNAGYHVIALNRTLNNEDWLEEIKCDIRNANEISCAFEYINGKYQCVDILVNNAGIRKFARVDKLKKEDWEESISTNLTAPLLLIHSTLKLLVRSKGLIVFIGSSAAEYAFEGGVAYSCTKAALHAMAETTIRDLRYEDVRSSYISLGATEITDWEESDADWKIKPEDVGKVIIAIAELPQRILPAYIDLRPAKPKRASSIGLERLQYL